MLIGNIALLFFHGFPSTNLARRRTHVVALVLDHGDDLHLERLRVSVCVQKEPANGMTDDE
jgi:hypothetical protein